MESALCSLPALEKSSVCIVGIRCISLITGTYEAAQEVCRDAGMFVGELYRRRHTTHNDTRLTTWSLWYCLTIEGSPLVKPQSYGSHAGSDD
jgi:hypothetical protein